MSNLVNGLTHSQWIEKLTSKFPHLFLDINIGIGWFPLVEKTITEMYALSENYKYQSFSIFEVKEDLGVLEVNYKMDTDSPELDFKLDNVIYNTRNESKSICSCCGRPSALKVVNTRLTTMCTICEEKLST